MDFEMTSGLVQHWVSVVDTRGRERLQAQWVSIEQTSALVIPRAAAPVPAQPAHAA